MLGLREGRKGGVCECMLSLGQPGEALVEGHDALQNGESGCDVLQSVHLLVPRIHEAHGSYPWHHTSSHGSTHL